MLQIFCFALKRILWIRTVDRTYGFARLHTVGGMFKRGYEKRQSKHISRLGGDCVANGAHKSHARCIVEVKEVREVLNSRCFVGR